MSAPEGSSSERAARSRGIARRSIGSPILFTIVYSSLASAIYFSLGVISGHALQRIVPMKPTLTAANSRLATIST